MASIYDSRNDWNDGLKQARLSDGQDNRIEEHIMTNIDLNAELERLNEMQSNGGESPYLKLTEGQYRLKFTGELTTPVEREFKPEGKKIKQSDIKCRLITKDKDGKDVEGLEKTWSVPLSKAGVYYQLVKLGANRKGLMNTFATILVKKKAGQNGKPINDYTIMEALGI